jgi:O-antigen/teichoic acid export membrane protein
LRGLAWKIETPVYQVLNYLFLLLSYGIFIWLIMLRPKQLLDWISKDHYLILVTIGSIAILSAVFSTLLSFGDPRFSIPIRPLIAIVLFSTAFFVFSRWQYSRSR